jgi:hypothetical protein
MLYCAYKAPSFFLLKKKKKFVLARNRVKQRDPKIGTDG